MSRQAPRSEATKQRIAEAMRRAHAGLSEAAERQVYRGPPEVAIEHAQAGRLASLWRYAESFNTTRENHA